MVDLHCHILPDVDDGARDMEESLRMLRRAWASGVRMVVATPHILPGVYEIGFSERKRLTSDLQKAASENEIEIQVKPGVEYYLSPELLEDSCKLQKLTINNNGKYILVELPMQTIPAFAEDVFFRLGIQGITPILAHPERNMQIYRDPGILFDYVTKGIIVQLNAGSLLGYFGKQVRKVARFLLSHKLVHVIASDMHSANSLTLGDAVALVKELLGSDYASRLFTENPLSIIDGRDFYKEPPQRPESGRKGLMAVFSRKRLF